MNSKKLCRLLLKKRLTISIAESCTGGLISKLLTDIPGSSGYFKLGIIAYSNQIKHQILKIPFFILNSKGAVSPEVASLLAKNVRKIAKTDIGLGITGIAGPSGATKAKPIGLVYIAIYLKNKKIIQKFLFKGNRNQIRQKSAAQALALIRKII